MPNLQTARTEKFIYISFEELLKKKAFSKITINDIATEAMINRSTFYVHFLDKYDLLNKFLKSRGATSNVNIEEVYQHPYTTFATVGNETLLPIFQFQSNDIEFRNAQFEFIMDFILESKSEKTELEKFFFIGRFKGLNMWIERTHQKLDPFVDYQKLDQIFITGREERQKK